MFARLSAAVLYLAAAFVAVDLVRNPAKRSPARIARMLAVIFAGTAMLVLTPGFAYERIDSFAGVANTARYLGNSLALCMAVSMQIMVLNWVYKDQKARAATLLRVAVVTAVITGMGICFYLTPTAQNTSDWQAANTNLLGISIYSALYFGHIVWTGIEIVRLAPAYARRVPFPHIRWGIWAFTVTGWGGIVYGGAGVIIAIADDLGLPRLPGQLRIPYLAGLGLAVLSLAVSCIISIVGLAVLKSIRATQCCMLRPFWAALTGPHQELLLETPARKLVYNLGCVFATEHRALARRVLEIRDVYHQLEPWMDQQANLLATTYARQAGLSGARLDATVEAAVIAVALYAKANGHPQTGTGEVSHGGEDYPAEVAWLLKVAKAFTGPIVLEMMAEVRRDSTPEGWIPRNLEDQGSQQ